ncbi:uncharacterized protein LOC116427561 [Nomia melanderi]|uniref:uncharacterized protein LOC116427561 n=1 Tax=Nomia melanderi TaxID=2448451 RepID=UPI0013046841|nr:uncharacterized protein LOC116427561 [Nomia melanderi]
MGAGARSSVEKIRGDGLCLRIASNERALEIIGDGCSVALGKNSGSVSVIGDGCRLRIDLNHGDVEYTGDGGRVVLGPKSTRNKVKYVGDGGRVSVDGELRTRAKRRDQATKEKIEKNEGGNEKQKDNGASKTAEEEDNRLNAKIETKSAKKEAKPAKKKEERAKIVTRLYCDQELVRKWFVNPGSVIESFDGSFAKTGPKERKSKTEVK